MKKKIFREENFIMSKWSGGNTRELAIFPEKAKYLDRDFMWRLSSADSDLEESSFTKLPDYDRILMVLEGDVVLAHGDERTASLKALEQDSFDGAVKTKCFGKLEKDYNLIYRKGSTARMELIETDSNAKAIETGLAAGEMGFAGEVAASYGIYTIEGYTVVSVNGQTEMVKADEQMIINCEPGEEIALSVMGQGKCIFVEIFYEMKISGFDIVSDEEVPKAGGSDYKLALKLFLSNNRWSKLIRREKKTGDFFSPELERKISTLDKFFITTIVWLAGMILCLFTYKMGLSTGMVVLLLLMFTAVDFLVISPLIYMAVLPKPLSAHIKDSRTLDAIERELFEKQAAHDPHQERLMYKYRERGEDDKVGLNDFLGKPKK